ncbi:NERD domain-containing protein [Cytobacillus spongiae]|jgi:DNA-directed RNA polymerase subunit M/transcription elongation factor TFIIS|uniref:nuclease-related domain-containing protein n=1 Tax=Cytobacillus spongiae TaxID=2901381 RepID=UPI001F1C5C79|nr:nuclease-related domain-containing protein [Cytobacillus spongiae]UII55867.1 NERD domain-containing protein [Cytobacillus spongiae]
MLLKNRIEPEELRILQCLHGRLELTNKEKRYASVQKKGFEGEQQFDQMIDNLREGHIILNDLLLQVNNSFFQIDTLIITQGVLYLLDIKNYEGDFYLESGKLFARKAEVPYKNPVDQLNRSVILLGQLLQNLDQPFLIDPYVLFINKDFTLYQAPMNQPFILPTQINRFLKTLHETSSQLDDRHKKLAQTLLSLHQPKNPFVTRPLYEYDQLKKGVFCKKCRFLLSLTPVKHFFCEQCGEIERFENAILRHTKEYQLLFPTRHITTRDIYDWCKVDVNPKTIYRILKRNYRKCGHKSGTYFI